MIKYAGYRLARSIKNLGHKFNLEIQFLSKSAPIDLTNHLDLHPVEATYLAGRKSALIRISTSRCIHMCYLASPCIQDTTSPFIKTLIDYQTGKHTEYRGSWLELFYQSFCPANAAEWMGLKDLRPNHPLVLQAAFGVPWFWVNADMKSQLKTRQYNTNMENINHGAKNIDYKHGNNMIGPVSEEKGNIEFQRLINIYKSIKKTGFKYNTNGLDNVSGVWLQSENDWRLFIASGQHRIAAAVTLNLPNIVVQVDQWGAGGIVNRSHIPHWILVKNKTLDIKKSIFLFDRIFNNVPPFSASEWIENINNHSPIKSSF